MIQDHWWPEVPCKLSLPLPGASSPGERDPRRRQSSAAPLPTILTRFVQIIYGGTPACLARLSDGPGERAYVRQTPTSGTDWEARRPVAIAVSIHSQRGWNSIPRPLGSDPGDEPASENLTDPHYLPSNGISYRLILGTCRTQLAGLNRLGAAGGSQYVVANAPTERRSRPASERSSRCPSERGVSFGLARATASMRTDERWDSSNEALDSAGPR